MEKGEKQAKKKCFLNCVLREPTRYIVVDEYFFTHTFLYKLYSALFMVLYMPVN